MQVEFNPRNVWRTGLVVIGLVALAMVLWTVFRAGSSLFFLIFTAWCISLAMEPAVVRLAQRMKRGLATGVVIIAIALFVIIFLALFGNMIIVQITSLVTAIPKIIDTALAWVESRFGFQYSVPEMLGLAQNNAGSFTNLAGSFASGILNAIGALFGAIGNLFVIVLLVFYLSACGPSLRRWLAGHFPPQAQQVFLTSWDIMAEKVGRYVGARLVLATVNATLSGIVFAILGLPSWLALALWTGIVAQFIPAIGTYISIALPALVGALSANPWHGLIVLGWGVVYQQIENLTIEPRISARAVNVNPAVAFCSVLLGTSMFGVAGALLSIPVVAMLLTMLELRRKRYEVIEAVNYDNAAEIPDDATANAPA